MSGRPTRKLALQVTFVPYWDPAQSLERLVYEEGQPPLFVDLMVFPLRSA